MKTEYNKVTVEAASSGWIVTEKGQEVKIFILWNQVLAHLEKRLTSKR